MQIAAGCRKLNEVGNEIEIETNGKLTGGGGVVSGRYTATDTFTALVLCLCRP